MIKEEYNYKDLEEFLISEIDLIIVGTPKEDEDRTTFFYNKWMEEKKDILMIDYNCDDFEKPYVSIKHFSKDSVTKEMKETMNKRITIFEIQGKLTSLEVRSKNILMDLGSLDHVTIMYLTKVLIKSVKPKTFFASYIRPINYDCTNKKLTYQLTSKTQALRNVPGFAKREKEKQTLCAFLGFEGYRLKPFQESLGEIGKTVVIAEFPSGNANWYNNTMRNSMNILSENLSDSEYILDKCFSESVFDAVKLLKKTYKCGEQIILAPIGTRPHSLACAIFACQEDNVMIMYDYAIENEKRTQGASDIRIYHLTSFIEE